MALALDTDPLHASLDRHDAAHSACRVLIESVAEPLVIPALVLVGTEYWINTRLHPGALVALLDHITAATYWVDDLRPQDYRRVRDLCDRYANGDIGFVDAAVLALVERLDEPKLATLDIATSPR